MTPSSQSLSTVLLQGVIVMGFAKVTQYNVFKVLLICYFLISFLHRIRFAYLLESKWNLRHLYLLRKHMYLVTQMGCTHARSPTHRRLHKDTLLLDCTWKVTQLFRELGLPSTSRRQEENLYTIHFPEPWTTSDIICHVFILATISHKWTSFCF